MKKFLLPLLIIMVVLFSSCEKETNNERYCREQYVKLEEGYQYEYNVYVSQMTSNPNEASAHLTRFNNSVDGINERAHSLSENYDCCCWTNKVHI